MDKETDKILKIIWTGFKIIVIASILIYLLIRRPIVLDHYDLIEIKQRFIRNGILIFLTFFFVPLSFLIQCIGFKRGRKAEKAEWMKEQPEKIKATIAKYKSIADQSIWKESFYRDRIKELQYMNKKNSEIFRNSLSIFSGYAVDDGEINKHVDK